jgi:hypothetical protein
VLASRYALNVQAKSEMPPNCDTTVGIAVVIMAESRLTRKVDPNVATVRSWRARPGLVGSAAGTKDHARSPANKSAFEPQTVVGRTSFQQTWLGVRPKNGLND